MSDKDNGVWVFDDPNDGLAREPFVASTDRMIEGSWPIVRTLPADSTLLSPPGHFLAMGTVGLAREDGGGKLVSIGAILLCHCQGPAEPRSIQSKHLARRPGSIGHSSNFYSRVRRFGADPQ